MASEPPSDWGELSSDRQQALLELADARVDGSMTRRQALKAGGVGVLGLLGLSGSASATNTGSTESAATPFDDGDGTIGTEDNRIDAYLDAADANSLSTGEVSITDFGQSADYVVFESGGDYHAYRTATQTVEASGTFRDALNQTRAAGTEVYIESGTHTLSTSFFPNSSNMTFRGSEGGTVIEAADGLDAGLFVFSASGITLESLTFDGNKANNSDTTGVNVGGSDDATVRFCTIRNCADNGVNRSDCDNLRVDSCTFDSNGNHDIGAIVEPANDHVLKDNTHINSGVHSVFVASDGEIVDGATVIGGSPQNTSMSVDQTANNWKITDTTYKNVGNSCIEVEPGASNGEIRGVTCESPGQNGIQVGADNVDIFNCKVVDAGLAGYRIGSDSVTFNEMLISGGKALNCGQSNANPGFDFIDTGQGSGIVLSGIVASDTQSTATQTYGVDAGSNWSGILVDGASMSGNSSGATNGPVTTGDTV